MNRKSHSCAFQNGFLLLLFCASSGYANAQPSAVQNAQMVYDDSSNSFVVSWDPPPETVTEYDLTYWNEKMDLSAVGGDAVYGYEVEKDYGMNVDVSDPFPPTTTQIVMPAGPDVYGWRAYASIRPKNTQGYGPAVTLQMEGSVQPPSAPSNLTYEIREDELVAYFSWDSLSTANIPDSLDVYYRVDYVSDSGVSGYKYYSSNFAALDITDDQYWDYSVSACVYEACGNAATIRAELTTRQVEIVESGFESGMPYDWATNGNYWRVRSGKTPSSLTGPGRAASGSSYVYFETSSPAGPGHMAILESPNFNPHNSRLYFSYHMYGSTMGTLYVEVYEDGWNTIWQRSGQQHGGYYSAWTDVEIDLSAYESDMKVRFRGVDGNGDRGDMALDDIRITAVVSTNGGLEEFDDSYAVRRGDIDGNGLLDLFLVREGEDGASANSFVISQTAVGSYSVVRPLTNAQTSLVANWPAASVKVGIVDVNMDARPDMILTGLSPVTGTSDQIVFASSIEGDSPGPVIEIDDEMRSFHHDVYNWMLNPDYYEENAEEVTETVTTRDYQYLGYNYSTYPAPFLCLSYDACGWLIADIDDPGGYGPDDPNVENVVHWWAWDYVTETITRLDYSGFNQNALAFSDAFGRALEQYAIEALSNEALTIESILEAIFQVEIMKKVLSQIGIILEQELGIPVGDRDDVRGFIILMTISETAEEITDVGDWRYLTTLEKITLANYNGLDIKNIDKVKVYKKGYFGGLATDYMAPNGHIYIPKNGQWSEDYALEPGIWIRGTFVHELHHVYQNRNRNCKLWNGCMAVKGITQRSYCYEFDVNRDFWSYPLEEEAEIVEDRYRLRQGDVAEKACNRGQAMLPEYEQLIPF